MDAKMAAAMKSLQKAEEIQKVMGVINTVMKILGPLAAVVCLVLAIATGGVLAILLAVGLYRHRTPVFLYQYHQ